MRILLYIPTFIDVTAPLLGVPSLVAYLKENGCSDIIVKDLNLEILEYLVESNYLDTQAKKVIQDFERLNDLKELTVENCKEYETLYPLYSFCQPNFQRKLEEYLYILRERDRFYDVPYYVLHIKGFFDNLFKLINYKNSLGLDYLFACQVNEEISEDHKLFPQFYKSRILPQASKIQPDLIGFSVCYRDQFQPAVYLAQLLKENFPAVPIVMGGTHLNVLKDKDLTTEKKYFSYVDAYLLGEGEIPFLALVKELENKGDLFRAPNLIYLQEGSVRINPAVEVLPVNQLPAPDFSCLPLQNYLAPELVLSYRVTRGCYWNQCVFCVHFQTKHFSYRKAHRVVEDIKTMSLKYDTVFFYFVDDSLPKAFLDKFLELLEQEKINIHWVGNIRCEEFLTTEYIKKLAQSGCRELYLGIESGSQRILDLIKKGINIATVERIIHDCHRYSIAVKMNYIKGLPHEDKHDIEATMNFIQRTAKNSDIIALTPLGIGENTNIARDPGYFGVEILDKKDPSRLFLNFRRTKGILSFEEIDRLYDEHPILFDRFTFFNRIHHFLYTLKFSDRDFQELTPRMGLITETLENYLLRDITDLSLQLEKKPLFKNNHQPQVFNFNTRQIQEMSKGEGAGTLTPRQTIYLYSRLNFEILADI